LIIHALLFFRHASCKYLLHKIGKQESELLDIESMGTLVCLIRSENFEQEVIAEKRPVLILCMPRDDEFPQQLKIIEDIATKHSQELKVAVLEEGLIEAFKKNYRVIGTPTFLLLVEGKERGRMLGLADQEMLTDLVLHS
jgi:thioredoxin-like negative regulator of GroEL